MTHHLIKLTRDLNTAKNEWKSETYWAFGKTVGEMVSIATQPASTEEMLGKPISDLTTNEYNTMLAGIVNGVLKQEGLTEITTCIGDGEAEAKLAVKGFEDLLHKQWTTGFKELGQVVTGLPHVLTDCKNISDDITKLESWATIFQDTAALPDLIKSNVTHHLIKLTRDLNTAKNEWKAETYWAFGTTLGEMLTIATQPLTMPF